jgi:hypothetical protein
MNFIPHANLTRFDDSDVYNQSSYFLKFMPFYAVSWMQIASDNVNYVFERILFVSFKTDKNDRRLHASYGMEELCDWPRGWYWLKQSHSVEKDFILTK